MNDMTSTYKEKHFIGKHETVREDTQIGEACLLSEANGNQDNSDVVGTAPPHCLTGQLLAGRFKPQFFLSQCWFLLYTALLLHWGRRLGGKNNIKLVILYKIRRDRGAIVRVSDDGNITVEFYIKLCLLKVRGGKYLQDAKDVFYCLISWKHFEQTITGKNNKPRTEKDRKTSELTAYWAGQCPLTCSKLQNKQDGNRTFINTIYAKLG